MLIGLKHRQSIFAKGEVRGALPSSQIAVGQHA
jgi:hypothetical protein